MNENSIRYPISPADHLDEAVRANPTNALLIAIGIGFAVALLVKTAQPKSPTNRLQSLVEDLEDRLHEVTKPAARRASLLAESGAGLLESTRDEMKSAVARAVHDGQRHLKSLFA